MAVFEVFASKDHHQIRFVGDRASIIALIFPAIWLAWNRLWFALIVYVLIAATLAGFNSLQGSTNWSVLAAILSFIPGLFIFLEGPRLKAERFERQGLQLVGLLEADSVESAEIKWFSKQGMSNRQQVEKPSEVFQNVPVNNDTKSRIDAEELPEFGIFAPDQ